MIMPFGFSISWLRVCSSRHVRVEEALKSSRQSRGEIHEYSSRGHVLLTGSNIGATNQKNDSLVSVQRSPFQKLLGLPLSKRARLVGCGFISSSSRNPETFITYHAFKVNKLLCREETLTDSYNISTATQLQRLFRE